MKLLNRTQRLFLWSATPVFVLAGIAMYYAFTFAFRDFAEEKLVGVQSEVENYVRLHDTLPVYFQSMTDHLEANPAPGSAMLPAVFSDTTIYNKEEKESEPFNKLSFSVQIKGQTWRVAVIQSALEHEDLAATVITLLAALFALLFGVLIWVNRSVSKKIWQPFFDTLDRMKQFRLTDDMPLNLGATKVEEFRELNKTLEELSRQVQHDFRTVKQFTEHASHELQTPLAVIQNKVEILLQTEDLNEQQALHLNIIGQSARRMARLNQSLLLLTKIDNNQFSELERLNLKPLVEKRLSWLDDFIVDKELAVSTFIADKWVDLNPVIADTLITNLLTNSVKHNIRQGTLEVRLNDARLAVKNSGKPSRIPVSNLTGRFIHDAPGGEGIGLGLALVQEICDKNGFEFRLTHEDDLWGAVVFFG